MTIIDDLKNDVRDFTGLAVADIGTIFATNAIRWVQSQIDAKGFTLANYPSASWGSTYPMLYAAAFYYMLELLLMAGKIEYMTGEISGEQLGRLRLTYQTSRQPRYFLAKNFDERLLRMLPHETFRMIAYSYIDMFYIDYMRGSIRKYGALAQFSKDVSGRGYGAYEEADYYDGESYVS